MDGFGDDFGAATNGNSNGNGNGNDSDSDFNVRDSEEVTAASNNHAAVPPQSGEDSPPPALTNARSAGSSMNPSPAPREPRDDPEVIKKWKEDQKARLEVKDREEKEACEALRLAAKKELEDWYVQHAEQLKALQASHRAASQSAERDFQSTSLPIEPGTAWDRVSKLCDFNPKAARNTKDVSRLRSIILQLKQGTPPSFAASAAADAAAQ